MDQGHPLSYAMAFNLLEKIKKPPPAHTPTVCKKHF
jgi:hypothetical protein